MRNTNCEWRYANKFIPTAAFSPASQANSRSEPQPQQSVEYPLGMEAAERRLQLQVFQFPEKSA